MAKKRTFKEVMEQARAAEALRAGTPADTTSVARPAAPAIPQAPPVDNTIDNSVLDAPAAEPETPISTPAVAAPTPAVADATKAGAGEDEDAIIQNAMKQLGDRLREAAPHIDFSAEYKKLLEENKRPERKGISPFKAFAISLGGGPQAVESARQSNEKANDEADSRWREIMSIREQALRGDIQQKLDEGKFKQALAQSEELARMNSALERAKGAREHGFRMEEIGKQNEGKKAVAQINADKAKDALNTKLQTLSNVYKLEGDIKKEFFKQMFRAMASRSIQQDITGQPVVSSDDFAQTLEDAMDWAEKHSGIDFTQPVPRPGSLGGNKPPANETPEQKALREIREAKKH